MQNVSTKTHISEKVDGELDRKDDGEDHLKHKQRYGEGRAGLRPHLGFHYREAVAARVQGLGLEFYSSFTVTARAHLFHADKSGPEQTPIVFHGGKAAEAANRKFTLKVLFS